MFVLSYDFYVEMIEWKIYIAKFYLDFKILMFKIASNFELRKIWILGFSTIILNFYKETDTLKFHGIRSIIITLLLSLIPLNSTKYIFSS